MELQLHDYNNIELAVQFHFFESIPRYKITTERRGCHIFVGMINLQKNIKRKNEYTHNPVS